MVEEIEYQSNGQPVAVDFEDLKRKLGYKSYAPKIGSLGRAIIAASKNQRSVGWLKHQLDTYFKRLRHSNKGNKK